MNDMRRYPAYEEDTVMSYHNNSVRFYPSTALKYNLRHLYSSPWAEFEFDNVTLTVPSETVRDLEHLDEVEDLWNDIMTAVSELAVTPQTFARKERFVADVQIAYGKFVFL